MISTDILEQLSAFSDNQGYSYLHGSFTCINSNEEEDGDVEILVAPSGKYLVWYLDEETGRLTGTFSRHGFEERLLIGPDVDLSEKLAVVNGISAEICS